MECWIDGDNLTTVKQHSNTPQLRITQFCSPEIKN